VIGWELDTHMYDVIEMLIGVILVDLVTIGLCSTLWLLSIEQISKILRAKKIFLPPWPHVLVAGLAFLSIVWVLVINILNYSLDRLWQRAYFFYWLSAIFCFGIVGLAVLVVYGTRKIGLSDFNERRIWTVVAFVFFMGAVAVPMQIMDGRSIIQDVDKPFNSPLEEGTANASKIFINIQALGLFIGIWFARINQEDSYGYNWL